MPLLVLNLFLYLKGKLRTAVMSSKPSSSNSIAFGAFDSYLFRIWFLAALALSISTASYTLRMSSFSSGWIDFGVLSKRFLEKCV